MSDAPLLQNVAVIGAGLGGCALALALSQRNVPVRIFENRPEKSDVIPSGVVLTPNGLRVLERLGVYERIKDRCYVSTHRIFKNDNDETTKKVELGGPDVYGFYNHRIWRGLLLDEMKTMLKERSIPIEHNSKFNGIISETYSSVTFRINDIERTASLLIGSDGIYSTVRKYLAPSIHPEYTGLVGILSHIRRDSVHWPYPNYEKNATIQSKPGAIFWIAEDPTGEEIMIGKQVEFPEQSRQDLENLMADKEKLAGFYREGYEEYGATARKIIDSVCARKETLYIWPFLKMPRIPQWYSDGGRVILVGDGAHALPPSSGQGVNMALEDVYSLKLLLCELESDASQQNGASSGDRRTEITQALAWWQQMRQKRIDAVYEWTTNGSNVSRLPEADRKKLIAEGKVKEGAWDDMKWLFKPEIEESVGEWSKNLRSAVRVS